MDKRKKKLTAIVLLAGYGNRISNLTKEPKSLLKINNQSILIRNLNYIKSVKIKNVILVLGYRADLIEEKIKKIKKKINIKIVYNKNYRKMGNTFSLLKGLSASKSKSIIFDGDLIYSKEILNDFINRGHNSSFLIGKSTLSNKECAKALVDNNGFVRKTVDKRFISKNELKRYKFVGEAIGIIKISNEVRKVMTKNLKIFFKKRKNFKLNWENFMNIFLKKNQINYNKTISTKWIEIDTKQDYQRAIKIFKN